MDRIKFTEYHYVGITGMVYHPTFHHNMWYLINDWLPMPLSRIAKLCNIPKDEVLVLALKYAEHHDR